MILGPESELESTFFSLGVEVRVWSPKFSNPGVRSPTKNTDSTFLHRTKAILPRETASKSEEYFSGHLQSSYPEKYRNSFEGQNYMSAKSIHFSVLRFTITYIYSKLH